MNSLGCRRTFILIVGKKEHVKKEEHKCSKKPEGKTKIVRRVEMCSFLLEWKFLCLYLNIVYFSEEGVRKQVDSSECEL